MSDPITITPAMEVLLNERKKSKNWQEVANNRGGIPLGVLCDFAVRGIEPKKAEYRFLLGLLNVGQVVFVGAGNIPDGCQVLGQYSICDCGQYYIPNHPRRARCFTCRPAKTKKDTL